MSAAGADVGVGSPSPATLAAWSSATSRWHRVPPATDGEDAFVAAVAGAVADGGYEVVFPCGDAEVLALSRGRDRIGAAIAMPEHHAVVTTFDKLVLAERARAAGVDVPCTVPYSDDAAAGFEYPALVKTRLHGTGTTSRIEARPVRDAPEARAAAGQVVRAGGEAVLQQRVEGGLMAVVVVTDRAGNLAAVAQQRAHLMWPPTTGISARAVTERVDRALLERVLAFLDDLSWWGLAELQFIDDGARRYLIDVNGRFYGSMSLSVAAGANLPDVWARAVLGSREVGIATARAGVRYQWLEGDLRRAFRQRRGGLVRDIASSLLYAGGAVHSMARARDPLPVSRFAAHLAGRRLSKTWRQGRAT